MKTPYHANVFPAYIPYQTPGPCEEGQFSGVYTETKLLSGLQIISLSFEENNLQTTYPARQG